MVLGLVGGVGSGKSVVTGILAEQYGYRLLLTDDIAKELELPGRPGYEALVGAFGLRILTDGAGSEIDKKQLAALIYADSEALEKVNALIHPIVWEYVERVVAQARGGTDQEVNIAVETALPCERFRQMCDEVWFIYADEDARIVRLQSNRGYSVEKCRSMMESQLSDEEFSAYADYIVDNTGDLGETAGRIRELVCG